MASTGPRVLIIGAGAIGCSAAIFLKQQGCDDVLLLDRGPIGSGSTPRAAGGLRAQFSTEINVRVSLLSLPDFKDSRNWLDVQTPYEEVGYLFLARSAEQAAAFQRNVALQRSLGVDSYWLTADEVEAGWPYLHPAGVHAATWCPTDALTDQVAVMRALAEQVRRLDVDVREHAAVSGLIQRNGRIAGVQLADEVIEADVTVLAAGVWSPTVAATVGLALPITASRREIFTSSPVAGLPERMPFIADFDIGSYVRRDADGFRISGGVQTTPDESSAVDAGRFPAAKEWATGLIPALGATELTGGWAGLTEITPDHHALLGVHPDYPGLIVATGFSGHGLMHAPAAGRLVAELVFDGVASSLDIAPLAPDRFERGAALAETMVTPLHEQGDIVVPATNEPSRDGGTD